MCGELEYTSTSNSPSDCPILSSQAICENWGKSLSQPAMKLPTGCYQPRCQNNHSFCKYFHTCPGKAPRSQRHLCMGVNRHLIAGVQKAQPTWQNVFVTKGSRFSVSASSEQRPSRFSLGTKKLCRVILHVGDSLSLCNDISIYNPRKSPFDRFGDREGGEPRGETFLPAKLSTRPDCTSFQLC